MNTTLTAALTHAGRLVAGWREELMVAAALLLAAACLAAIWAVWQ